MESNSKLEDLNLSNDEVKKLTEAFKDKEFRKLFAEYAEEIADPENKRKYEEEIRMLENERGMDVDFLHPEPGFVIKTTVNGTTKAFINVCTNDKIGKPSSQKVEGRGLNWSIPHSFSPPREDIDKKNEKCTVYDFVIHPDTYRMAESNIPFKKMVHDIAFDGISKQFDATVDTKNIKHPKIKYKGTPTATVIRKKKEDHQKDPEKEGTLLSEVMKNLKYPNEGLTSEELAKRKEEEIKKRKEEKNKKMAKENKPEKESDPLFEEPKYNIKYSSHMDMSNFTNAPNIAPSTRPSHIIIDVNLPLIKSASHVDLDVFEKRLSLQSEKGGKYKLDIKLPYPIDENHGNAKFDKARKVLSITLPVLPAKLNEEVITNGGDKESKSCDEKDLNNENGISELGTDSNNSVDKPLIEVLSTVDEPINENNSLESKNNDDEVEKDIVKPQILYSFPPSYDYNQDDETVTFILDVKNVSRDTVSESFKPYKNGCKVQMVSVGSGGFPMHFSFMVEFPEECCLEPENCYVSMSDVNVVITLVKVDACVGSWDKYKVGIDENHLEEKLFVTVSSLKPQLDKLDQEEQTIGATNEAVNMRDTHNVTEMSSDRLTLNIQNKNPVLPPTKSRKESEVADDEDEPTSPIEVVFDTELPKIPGILKQRSRTVSESSVEDVCGSSMNSTASRQSSSSSSSSGVSGPTEGESDSENVSSGERRRRHVSFSDHVDQATYKSNQSVSSMTPALKSKRRRIRKMQQKMAEKAEKAGRRRRNSNSVSEYSSGDEHQNNMVESRTEATAEANHKSGDDTLKSKDDDEATQQAPVIKAGGKGDVSASLHHLPERTSGNVGLVGGKQSKKNKKRKGKKGGKVVLPPTPTGREDDPRVADTTVHGNMKEADERTSEDATNAAQSVEGVQNGRDDGCMSVKNCDTRNGIDPGNDVLNGNDMKNGDVTKNGIDVKKDDMKSGDDTKNGGDSKNDDIMKNGNDKHNDNDGNDSDDYTENEMTNKMNDLNKASWDDGPKVAAPSHNVVALSNSVMYDLD